MVFSCNIIIMIMRLSIFINNLVGKRILYYIV